jgi:hypothetical protein
MRLSDGPAENCNRCNHVLAGLLPAMLHNHIARQEQDLCAGCKFTIAQGTKHNLGGGGYLRNILLMIFQEKFSPGARTELEVRLAKRFLAQYRRFGP